MSYETIIWSALNGTATITLNRPESLNSFNVTMHQEVKQAISDAESDANVRAVLITGSGRGFCAGQDLGDRRVSAGEEPVDLGATLDEYYNPLIRRIRSMQKPVVCAVNGVAAGAGANIALACDFVLAARSARFIQAFCKIGLVPDSGGTWILPRLIGEARAKALAMLGTPVSAEEAEALGMIYRAVDDDALSAEAQQLCDHFAAAPTRGLAAIKVALHSSWDHSLDQQLDLECDTQRQLGRSDDYREGVAAFFDKREAIFTGR